MELLIILFIIAWLISPIVLTILLVRKNSELKVLRKHLEAALMENRQRPVSHARETAETTAEAMTETVAETMAETVAETMAETTEAEVSMTKQPQSMESPYVQRPQHRADAQEKLQAEPGTVAGQSTPKQPVTECPRPVQPRPERPRPVVREPKETKQIPAIVWLFGIGIFLMLTAAAIFATSSTWNMMPAVGKIAVLLVTVSVFYIVAYISKAKLELENTSITFFVLGSSFMAIVNIAAAYLGWYGEYYTVGGGGIRLIWSISAFITSVCMIVGYVIYRTKVLGLLGYYFLLLTALLGADFAFDSAIPIAVCMGIVLAVAQAYVCLDEDRRGIEIIGKSHNIMCYIYAFLVCFITMAYERDDANSAMLILAFLALGLAGFRLYRQFGGGQTATKVLCLISTGLGILTLGFSIRYLEYFFLRLEVSLLIFTVIYIALTILRRREIYDRSTSLCVSWFAEITALVTIFAQFFAIALQDAGAQVILIVLLSAVIYVLEQMNGENRVAVMAAMTFFLGLIFKLSNMWDIANQTAITVVEVALVAVFVISGRLIYRKVVSIGEKGVLIDWLSICSASLLFIACLQHYGEIKILYVLLALWSVYIASYYGRENYIMDRIVLTLSVIWLALVGGNQPYIEINSQILTEWWILIVLVATGLIAIVWRRHSKAYSYVWLAVTAICFMAEGVEIVNWVSDAAFMARLAGYLVATAILAAFAFIKKNKPITVEVGVLLMMFSCFAYETDKIAIFILALLLSAGYFVYLHFEKMSVFAILPVAQLYITLFAMDIKEPGWLIVFAATVITSYVLGRVWKDDDKDWADDILGFSAIVPVLGIWNTGDDNWCFVGIIMLALFVLSFYKRYNDDSNAMINRIILTISSFIVAAAWCTQPFIKMEGLAETEWYIFAFMAVCVFNTVVVYKQDTNDVWGWITFGVAIMCIIAQAQCAIADGDIIAALILGVAMLLVLVWAFATKRKQWFMLAAITLIAQCIYASREFWTSIAWWVYLLVAGVALITIAARTEYKKRLGIDEKKSENKHFLEGWRL